MNVLVIGSGGREHALCRTLAASPVVESVFCAPGSDGIAKHAEIVPIRADRHDDIASFASGHAVDLVVVGPEAPLADGLVDRLTSRRIRAFGPSAAAARLEGSKAFMKAFAERHGIPTAAHRTFTRDQRAEAVDYVSASAIPVVIKVDGLAAGKGVTVAEDRATAQAAIESAFDGQFGEAGQTLVIEEFLEGQEASLFAICDGNTALAIGTAQDHKRAYDGDRGPNTGGMGAYSPAPLLDPSMTERTMAEIVRPTMQGMAEEGYPYTGFLYAGLMIGPAGPKLVEYNVRFGDPEAQVVLPRLQTDLCQLLVDACDGRLDRASVRFSARFALTVVLATRGYPGAYATGSRIGGLDRLVDAEDVLVFHAGTARDDDGWRAVGGRVLNITGLGDSIRAARDRAYDAVARIDWPEGYYRTDIGWRALSRA